MRGGAYKIIVSETREMFTLPKGLFPGQAGGEGFTVHLVAIWAKNY